IKGRNQRYVLDKLAEFLGGDSNRYAENDASDTKGFAADDPLLARKVLAEANREGFSAVDGHDYSAASDSEMLDNLTYNIFPNFAPWGGFVPNLVYRWRPGEDADHSLMEIRILMRTPKGTTAPKAPPMHLIPPDQPFASVAHIIGEGLAG